MVDRNYSFSFLKKTKPFVKVPDAPPPAKQNIFDVTRAMTRLRLTEALKILSGLLRDGTHPLQLMGGLVWFWKKCRNRFQTSPDKYEKGLVILQEADLNLKRSRLRPDHALEVLVVKLCGILGR